MPKLAVIDPAVSTGVNERFFHGSVEDILELPKTDEYDIALLLNWIALHNDKRGEN